MKTKQFIKLAFVALFAGILFQSCQKDEVTPNNDLTGKPSYTVRPDFATVDFRPADVIAKFTLTDKNTQTVKLQDNATKGKYALVIGISDYAGTANDLTYCDDDAIDWKARLQTEGYTVTSLLDLNATASNIDAAVTTLAGLAVAGNEIAFVYSGHGSSGNIISTDLYYISSSWFKTKFAAATSTKMMFSFDACQIGAMKTALNAAGRIVIVASDTKKYSYDGDATMKNGVFTYYQMKGFDQQGYIYLEPDSQYACDQMIIWASANRVRVAPSFVDSYTGDYDL